MVTVKIKPLSVNEVWRGKRFKTGKYTRYERDLYLLLPRMEVPEGKLHVKLIFGLSSSLGDIDNPVKPFLDVLQKKYGFNDKQVYRLSVEKKDVKRGFEHVLFEIIPM